MCFVCPLKGTDTRGLSFYYAEIAALAQREARSFRGQVANAGVEHGGVVGVEGGVCWRAIAEQGLGADGKQVALLRRY